MGAEAEQPGSETGAEESSGRFARLRERLLRLKADVTDLAGETIGRGRDHVASGMRDGARRLRRGTHGLIVAAGVALAALALLLGGLGFLLWALYAALGDHLGRAAAAATTGAIALVLALLGLALARRLVRVTRNGP